MEKNKQAVEKTLEADIEQKIEVENVTIKLPKAIMNLLRAYRENIQTYMEYTILGGFVSDIESCDGPFGNYNDIVQKFNLEPVFKAYDLSYTPLNR